MPTATASPPRASAPLPAARRQWQLLVRSLVATAAGVMLYASFPPRQLWWLAPLSFAVLFVVLRGRRASGGLAYGALFGAGFLLPLLVWTGQYVGDIPWLALVALETTFFAGAGAGIAVVSRLPGAPLWAAGTWAAGEAARGRIPFGGFPWGKVAFGQPDGAFLPLVALGGTPLLSFAVVLSGFALGHLLVLSSTSRSRRRLVPVATLALAPLLAGLAASSAVGAAAGRPEIIVAAVQGNVPRMGLDFNAQRRAVLDNHVRRTEQLATDVRSGRVSAPDLVIWPENSSDIDPFRNPDAAEAIGQTVDAVGAPTLIGAVTRGEDGAPRNTAIQWQPGAGPRDTYVKRRIQPFGEYIPLRGLSRLVSSDVDRVRQDMVPGDGPGVLRTGPATVGVATCYEVAFDDTVANSVRAGAQLLAVPTNNATFGRTEMTYQQLAMSRVRAVEHDRSVVVAATSGVSAIILPDGTVVDRTELFAPGLLVERVPLRATTTLATHLGAIPEFLLVGLGVGALAVAVTRRRIAP